MKESNSERPEKEKKAKSSIMSSAKKALNVLDPVMEKSEKNGPENDQPEDSKTDVKSNKESKSSAWGNVSTVEDIKKAKSPRDENIPQQSKKTEFNSIKQRFNRYKTLIKEDKPRFIAILGLGAGIILILIGISLLFGTSDKVSDNVVFGERSVTSAFFIIVGLLIISAIYAPKIIGKTSFDDMYQEMKGVEDDSSSKKEKNFKKDESKNNSLKDENKSPVKTYVSEKGPKKEK